MALMIAVVTTASVTHIHVAPSDDALHVDDHHHDHTDGPSHEGTEHALCDMCLAQATTDGNNPTEPRVMGRITVTTDEPIVVYRVMPLRIVESFYVRGPPAVLS